MKQILLTVGLIFILGLGQSFTPSKIATNSKQSIIENSEFAPDYQDRTKIYAPARPDKCKLYMYDKYETTESLDWFADQALMDAARILYCPDWHHYVEWMKIDGVMEVVCTGDCAPPPLCFVPQKSDFAPLDAIVLTLPVN
jgi:hypothetical protein